MDTFHSIIGGAQWFFKYLMPVFGVLFTQLAINLYRVKGRNREQNFKLLCFVAAALLEWAGAIILWKPYF